LLKRIIKRKSHRHVFLTLIAIGVMAIAFHFWLMYFTKKLMEDQVAEYSKNAVKLKIGDFNFNWITSKIYMGNAVFSTNHKNQNPTSYKFEIPSLRLNLQSLWPLIFEKKILIESLVLDHPRALVTQLRKGRNKDSTVENDISLAYEMGKIYNSIEQALRLLQVEKFRIDKGAFSLVNKSRTDRLPVHIYGIDFKLNNLQVDKKKKRFKSKILFSDDIDIQTTNQNIVFPDGMHSLRFKKFKLNVRDRIAYFDSCQFTANKEGATKSTFSMYFDKLKLTKIDFQSLYQSELIKADSVFCTNPHFNLYIEGEKNKGKSKEKGKEKGKGINISQLVRVLTGKLYLEHVFIDNAAFVVNTLLNGVPNNFTSNNTVLNITGLSVNENNEQPINIRKLRLAVRNYKTFLKDSTMSIKFDSVLIGNNKISLSNFAYSRTTPEGKTNSISMPLFQLQGLSWNDLILKRQLNAEDVQLYSPKIDFHAPEKAKKNAQTIFETLAQVGKIIELNSFNMVNGEINMFLANHAKVQLQNANLSVASEKFDEKKKIETLSSVIEKLSFKQGVIQFGNIESTLGGVVFEGKNNSLKADHLRLSVKGQLSVNANNIDLKKMSFEQKQKSIFIDGLHWEKADVLLLPSLGNSGKSQKQTLILHDVSGGSTVLNSLNKDFNISGTLANLSADKIEINDKPFPEIEKLIFEGDKLSFQNKKMLLKLGSIQFKDHEYAQIEQIDFENKSKEGLYKFSLPSLTFMPHLASLLNSNFTMPELNIVNPTIVIRSTKEAKERAPFTLPKLDIKFLNIENPNLQSEGKIPSWHGTTANNYLKIQNLFFDPKNGEDLKISQIDLSINDTVLLNNLSNDVKTNGGKAVAKLSDISVGKDVGNFRINAFLNSFSLSDIQYKKPKTDSRFNLQNISVSNLMFNSDSIKSVDYFLNPAQKFVLTNAAGSFRTITSNIDWGGFSFNNDKKLIRLDSASIIPVLHPKDYFVPGPAQKDYMRFSMGEILISGWQHNAFFFNNVYIADSASISNLHYYIYRDKAFPRPDFIKPLPVDMVKKIPISIALDKLAIKDSYVEYEELTTEKEAVIIDVENIEVVARNIDNSTHPDSLFFEATTTIAKEFPMYLKFHQSYRDSLKGFLIEEKIDAASLTSLNSFLIPMEHAQVTSGELQKLHFRAAGNTKETVGNMKMYYKDLKVKYDPPKIKSKFVKRTLNFLINLFVKNNNSDRVKAFYVPEKKEKSIINYILRMHLQGAINSVGVPLKRKKSREIQKKSPAYNWLQELKQE